LATPLPAKGIPRFDKDARWSPVPKPGIYVAAFASVDREFCDSAMAQQSALQYTNDNSDEAITLVTWCLMKRISDIQIKDAAPHIFTRPFLFLEPNTYMMEIASFLHILCSIEDDVIRLQDLFNSRVSSVTV